MYNFDDKWRRQLLEDALVTGLLETKLAALPTTPSAQPTWQRLEPVPSGGTANPRSAS